ncbi:hypothetical protein QJS04_geneDACA013268 [Acorus gramineus]|uniref:Uncharacterized protein n=1 Tax=Acorus gramineus TaxID=55184 RepID=A0AAV9B860_ACOGR|nr:hypothetical protein QJS04_geneDACA013268 [Acorus gramineus]
MLERFLQQLGHLQAIPKEPIRPDRKTRRPWWQWALYGAMGGSLVGSKIKSPQNAKAMGHRSRIHGVV